MFAARVFSHHSRHLPQDSTLASRRAVAESRAGTRCWRESLVRRSGNEGNENPGSCSYRRIVCDRGSVRARAGSVADQSGRCGDGAAGCQAADDHRSALARASSSLGLASPSSLGPLASPPSLGPVAPSSSLARAALASPSSPPLVVRGLRQQRCFPTEKQARFAVVNAPFRPRSVRHL